MDRDGLVLRVSQLGVMTWTVTYRVYGKGHASGTRIESLAGPKRRERLGEYPTMGLAEARIKAAEIKREARAGRDPTSRATNRKDAPTVQSLIDRYFNEHLSRDMKSGSNVQKLLRLHVSPRWGSRPIVSIKRSDFIDLLEAVRTPVLTPISGARGDYEALRGGPGAAAEVRKWTQAMFQFARDVGLIDANPLAGVSNRDRQTPRDRVLSMDEVRCVLLAAAKLEYPWRQFIELVTLTGDRRGEWANSQVDWIQAENLAVPSKKHKSEKAQLLPLSRQALKIVDGMPKPVSGPYLFSTQGGATPISGFSYAKRLLDAAIKKTCNPGPAPWRLHDLRRTAATNMERLGVAPHVIEACLGHSLKGVEAVYRLYGYLPEKKEALQRWADEILTDDLVPIGSPPIRASDC